MTPAQRDAKRAWDREYARTHLEENRRRAREWGRQHRARARARHRVWRRAKPEQFLDIRRRRRARKRLAGNRFLTAAQWAEILWHHDYVCYYCGVSGKLTQDHQTPICRGGEHTVENVVPACLVCNRTKARQTTAEFLAVLGVTPAVLDAALEAML